MTWDAVGALAELLGALGVVITLVVLASQIRQNTRAVRAATNHSLTQHRNELNLTFGLDPSAMAFMLRVSAEGLDALDLADRERYRLLMRAILGASENTWIQARDGFAEDGAWEANCAVLESIVAGSTFTQWWAMDRSIFLPGFRNEIDTMIGGAAS